MADSLYRRFGLAGVILAISFGLAAILDLIGALQAVGPCGCGGRCCQKAEPPGIRAADPDEFRLPLEIVLEVPVVESEGSTIE